MLLTFNVLYDKLMDQSKLQTCRLDWERWGNWAEKAERCSEVQQVLPTVVSKLTVHSNDRPLQIYWRSPRVGGTHLGDGLLRELEVKKRIRLTEEDARLDGFDTLPEFIRAVTERSPKKYIEPSTLVGLLTFEWTDGPYDVVCHHCMKKPVIGPHVSHCWDCCGTKAPCIAKGGRE